MQKHMHQVDATTGERIEGFVAYVVPKRVNGFKQGWLAMAQTGFMTRLAMADIGDEARRVLFVLLDNVEYENSVLVPQAELAKKIGMARGNFNRAVKRLISEGVIEKGPKIGRMVSLKINPEYAWKGSAKNHVIALDSERKRRMDAAGISGVIDGTRSAPPDAAEREELEARGQARVFED